MKTKFISIKIPRAGQNHLSDVYYEKCAKRITDVLWTGVPWPVSEKMVVDYLSRLERITFDELLNKAKEKRNRN